MQVLFVENVVSSNRTRIVGHPEVEAGTGPPR